MGSEGAMRELQADQDADQVLCDLGSGACPLCVQQRPVNFSVRDSSLQEGDDGQPLLSLETREVFGLNGSVLTNY